MAKNIENKSLFGKLKELKRIIDERLKENFVKLSIVSSHLQLASQQLSSSIHPHYIIVNSSSTVL